MEEFDTYLFDFDGTLVDSLKSLVDVFTLSFKAIGIEIKEENVLQYTRQPLLDTCVSLNAPMEKAGEFEMAIRFYLDDKEVLKKTEIYPETKRFLASLKNSGVKIGIVTSNNERHVLDVLSLFNIPSDTFEIIVDSDKERDTKPSPKPLLYALKELNYLDKKDRVVYVGDALNDMLSAKNAGVDGILVDRVNAFKDDELYIRVNNLEEIEY